MEVKLKQSDTDKIREINRENKYNLDYDDLFELINEYQQGDEYTRKLIEYRLEDLYFYDVKTSLRKGEYDQLRRELKREYQERIYMYDAGADILYYKRKRRLGEDED